MGALGARKERRVKTLVAHSIATTIVEAEVVARTGECGGCGGKASRKSDDVGKHDDLKDEVQISDRSASWRQKVRSECKERMSLRLYQRSVWTKDLKE